MKIHLYCSYRLSPVGYKYCYCSSDDYTLSEESSDMFVLESFECGYIKKFKGRKNGKYYLIVNRLVYDYGNDHADLKRDVTINIAFEFDKKKDYEIFSNNFEKYAFSSNDSGYLKELCWEIADCIDPTDKDQSKFGYVINKDNFDRFLEAMQKTQNEIIPEDKNEEDFSDHYEIISEYENDVGDKIKEALNIELDYTMESVGTTSTKYVFPKKKRLIPITTIILILTGLIIFAAIFLRRR